MKNREKKVVTHLSGERKTRSGTSNDHSWTMTKKRRRTPGNEILEGLGVQGTEMNSGVSEWTMKNRERNQYEWCRWLVGQGTTNQGSSRRKGARKFLRITPARVL